MSQKLLRKLRKETDDKIEDVVDILLKNVPGKDVKSNLEWIENSSKLLSYKKRKNKQLILASAALIICTVIAGGLWAISKSRINVSMNTVSSNVTFKLSEDWSLPAPFTTGNLRIENFQALHAPELGIAFEDDTGSAQLEVSGKNIVIEKIGVG
jgi:hypothetical protein